MNQTKTVAIAGASGFVGRALCAELTKDYNVRALSRSARSDSEGISWRACDLFSLKDCERALEGCDYAIYLVHSMSMPSPLSQASFEDLDLILADNFARAAASCGVKHTIYLSGLIEQGHADHRSAHLASRLEVEQTLEAWGGNVTTLRAGLVVGPHGSSLVILTRLVKRLPMMITPRWTDHLTQPVALVDVVRAVKEVLADPEAYQGPFDIGSNDVMSYREMMQRTAKVMGKRRLMLRVPFLSPRLSSLWVSLVTGISRSLVAPLVQSLRHNMVAKENPLMRKLAAQATSFESAVQNSLQEEAKARSNKVQSKTKKPRATPPKIARSVQRLHLPAQKNATWVAKEYLDWLDRSPLGLIQTRRQGDEISFHLRFFSASLLNMRYAPDRSFPDRALFYVYAGALVSDDAPRTCRLEFRESRVGHHIIAAVHDFCPSLPWYIYRYTQALAHLLVMYLFGRHLRRASCSGERRSLSRASA